MSEPVVTIAEIASSAEAAAREMVLSHAQAVNPYPPMSDAAHRWNVTLQRFLLQFSAAEVEGGA